MNEKRLLLLRLLFVRLRFILVFVAVGLVVGNWDWIKNAIERATRTGPAKDHVQGEFEWYCPMHPSVVRNDSSQPCPVCNMPLSRRKRNEKEAMPEGILSRVVLSPERIRLAGLATEPVGFRTLVREIRTVGFVEWDERRTARLSARIAGRADDLYVNFTGSRVKEGDPVYRLYSPDLIESQEAYLASLRTLDDVRAQPRPAPEAVDRAKRAVESARERLRLWGITEAQITELEHTKRTRTHVTIYSPISGIVVEKTIFAGHYVSLGDNPYTIVDDSVVWMQAEVFERDLGLVELGQEAEIRTESFPGEVFRGTVDFVWPEMQRETRTVRVRVEVQNPSGKLKAGMYATAVLRIPLGRRTEVAYGCCERCPDVRQEEPGTCPRCRKELVLQPVREAPAAPGFVYRCKMGETFDGGVRDAPGPCPVCGMMLDETYKVPREQWERERPSPPAPARKDALPEFVYRCKMGDTFDGGVRDTPGPCPVCGMNLDERFKVPKEQWERERPPPPAPPPKEAGPEFVYRCKMGDTFDGGVRETPGPCPLCGMTLDERFKVPKEQWERERRRIKPETTEPQSGRKIYVCDEHPEQVFDKPGQCFKGDCAGMRLRERTIAPGAELVYVCPDHPDVRSNQPGACPRDGKPLRYRIESGTKREGETWSCPMHPERRFERKAPCPDCGTPARHYVETQVLAVPASAVIDTGFRHIVFRDAGDGVFEAVRVDLGPRAGEYYAVQKGLVAGDRVVTSGAFLLDAETRLNPAAAAAYFGASGAK